MRAGYGDGDRDEIESSRSSSPVAASEGLESEDGGELSGGEAIGRAMWDKLKAAPHTHFHNMYGPTEATVDATIGSMSIRPEK